MSQLYVRKERMARCTLNNIVSFVISVVSIAYINIQQTRQSKEVNVE